MDKQAKLERAVILDEIQRIVVLPRIGILASLIKAVANAEAMDLRALENAVSSEPSITAKLLSMANSAYWSGAGEIRSVKEAIGRLGSQRFKCVVLSIVAAGCFQGPACPAFDMKRYWRDSIALGTCTSHVIGQNGTHMDQALGYCIGMLARIGLLALVNCFPGPMHAVLAGAESGLLRKREAEQFAGLDHYAVGAQLLRAWQLPEAFHQTVSALHPSPRPARIDPVAHAVIIADQLVAHGFYPAQQADSKNLGLNDKQLALVHAAFEKDRAWIEYLAEQL